jgi:hypothetical protein
MPDTRRSILDEHGELMGEIVGGFISGSHFNSAAQLMKTALERLGVPVETFNEWIRLGKPKKFLTPEQEKKAEEWEKRWMKKR